MIVCVGLRLGAVIPSLVGDVAGAAWPILSLVKSSLEDRVLGTGGWGVEGGPVPDTLPFLMENLKPFLSVQL